MPRASTRKAAQAPQVPGAEGAAAESSQDQKPEISPEVQALIDAEVRRRLQARQAGAPADNSGLPTQEEAQVEADKKGRAVLSRDGYVVPTPKPVQKDEHGFAKA